MFIKPVRIDGNDIVQLSDDVFLQQHTDLGWVPFLPTGEQNGERIFDARHLFRHSGAKAIILADDQSRIWYFELGKPPIQLANWIQLNGNSYLCDHRGY